MKKDEQVMSLSHYHKIINQLFRCYENRHSSNHRLYVSQFGNINCDGFFIYYTLPGVDPTYWKEISYQDFAKSARAEAISLIEFIIENKRLPNWCLNDIPYEYRTHL